MSFRGARRTGGAGDACRGRCGGCCGRCGGRSGCGGAACGAIWKTGTRFTAKVFWFRATLVGSDFCTAARFLTIATLKIASKLGSTNTLWIFVGFMHPTSRKNAYCPRTPGCIWSATVTVNKPPPKCQSAISPSANDVEAHVRLGKSLGLGPTWPKK